MKKFIITILWFIVPILALYLFTFIFYNPNKGDLLRIGYIIDLYPSYRDIFKDEFGSKLKFSKMSEKKETRKFKVLTIGDSFSEQNNYSYQNYLAKNNIETLHIEKFLHENQTQTLYSFLNGDFFDQYSFDFIVLQFVERYSVGMVENIDTAKVLTSEELGNLVNKPRAEEIYNLKFPSDSVLKFPYYTLQHYLNKDYVFEGKTYKTQITQDLFSVGNKELLFYFDDIVSVNKNSDENKVRKLNAVFNDLSNLLKKKGIKLIVLPSPDKYDIYYEFILNKSKYPKPIFFELFDKLNKEYTYIDSKQILTNALSVKKDIYFYDDSHWSPWASQIIAGAISKEIKLQER